MTRSYDRQMLLTRKVVLETALQEARDEFQRIAGAIQFVDTLVAELDAPEKQESEEKNDRIKS